MSDVATPTQQAAQRDNGPYEVNKIPDRWDFIHNPRGIDKRTAQIQYNPDASKYNPVSCIYIITPQSNDVDSIVVEVQDENAEKSVMGKALPVAESESFDSMDAAVEQVYAFAEQYPLPATRVGDDIDICYKADSRPFDLSLAQAEEIITEIREYSRVITADILCGQSSTPDGGYAVGFVFTITNGCESVGEIHTPKEDSLIPELQAEYPDSGEGGT